MDGEVVTGQWLSYCPRSDDSPSCTVSPWLDKGDETASRLDRVPAVLQRLGRPNLLTSRTIVPTTATLSAFAMIVLLIGSLGGVGASFATDGTTITTPDAKHPVNSQIPESYAGAIDDPEIATSPEILLFGYTDGEPYLARGGSYDSFAAVTDAEFVADGISVRRGEVTLLEEIALSVPSDSRLLINGPSGAGKTTLFTILGLLEILEIRDCADHYSTTLSGGGKQRVAIARALANRPDMVLADELTGQLDPKTTDRVASLLLDVQESTETALVTISHDPVLEPLHDQTRTLRDGRLLEADTAE